MIVVMETLVKARLVRVKSKLGMCVMINLINLIIFLLLDFQALVELLQDKPFDDCDSIIIYVTRRNDADRLAVLLRTSLPDFVPKPSEMTVNKKTKGRYEAKQAFKIKI